MRSIDGPTTTEEMEWITHEGKKSKNTTIWSAQKTTEWENRNSKKKCKCDASALFLRRITYIKGKSLIIMVKLIEIYWSTMAILTAAKFLPNLRKYV